MSKRADIYRKQLEVEDPLVIQLGIQGGLDLGYVEILNHIENKTEYKDLPQDCELRLMYDSIPNLGIAELRDGHRLVVRNGGEVLIPKSAREEIVRTLHITHPATETMINQTKGKIFWPKMRQDLQKFYEKCEECTIHGNSRPQKDNEISMTSIFENFSQIKEYR